MSRLRSSWTILLAAALLLATGLACNALSGLAGEATATPRPTQGATSEPIAEPTEAGEPTEEPTAEPTEASEPTEEPTEASEPTEAPTEALGEDTPAPPVGNVLFEDAFDENANGWDEDTTDTAARDLRDGVYAMQVFNTVWFAWANPETDDLEDVHLKVTVSNVGGNDPAFGVLCSYLNADAFYFLGFGDDGYYGIARIEGDDFILLTSEENFWVQSDDIELFQDSYELEADCHADGTLRLIVDGVTIDEARDEDPYGAGGIGLFVQSFDSVPVEVEFDDLLVTRIEE